MPRPFEDCLPEEIATAFTAAFGELVDDRENRIMLRDSLRDPTAAARTDSITTGQLLTAMRLAGWIMRTTDHRRRWQRTPVGDTVLELLEDTLRDRPTPTSGTPAEIAYNLSEAGRAAVYAATGQRVPREQMVRGSITEDDRHLFAFDGQGVGIKYVPGEFRERQTFEAMLAMLREKGLQEP